MCPVCGSLSRNRRLWQILETGYLEQAGRILDFSPSGCLYRILKKKKQEQYVSTDLAGEFVAREHYDITSIPVNDGSFDLVICYHVLEHVEDDRKAMRELFRVMDKKGTCIIQTPFKEGDIYEDPNIKDAAGRLRHFGQADHVRIYSIKGLQQRLTECGFKVEILTFAESKNNIFGFRENETVLLAR
jgi:SAM-dependent methyltransferase